MPELPEVEYIARQLRAELMGIRITQAFVYWPGSISDSGPDAFEAAVAGKRITDIDRRGKYLLVGLEQDQVLIIHRGMSGNLLLAEDPSRALYVRVAFRLDDGRYLLYSDPRKFGRLRLLARDQLAARFAELGPEPLDEAFSARSLQRKLAGSKRIIKTALLDQRIVAGLGNIYADEALFAARIHPARIAGELSPDEINALAASIPAVLQTGIDHGGTTFGRHRDVHDQAGTNLEHVKVYRRTNQPCLRCGTPIERLVLGQRSTHFCPACQRLSKQDAGHEPAVSA